MLLAVLAVSLTGYGQQPPAARFESLVAQAQKAQAVRDYAAAAAAYKQAVKVEPAMPELWANLGLMQHEAGDIEGAIESLQHANRLKPSLFVPNLLLGIDLVRTDKANEAVPYLTKAEKANPADAQAPLALGRAYMFTGKYAAAAEQLDRAIALNPKLGSAWFTLGIARLNQVEADAYRISQENKQSPYAEALYAESLCKQGRFGEAANLYKTLPDGLAEPPCHRSERGLALIREHEPAEAAAEFAAERSAHPECSLALLGQARLALDEEQATQAAKLFAQLWDRDHGFVRANAAIVLDGLAEDQASVLVAAVADPARMELTAELRGALLTAFNAMPPGADHAPNETAAAAPAAETAQQLYAAGHFQQCEQKLNASAAPLSAEKLHLLAACAYFSGDDRQVSSAADRLAKLQPHSVEALFWSIRSNEHLAFKALDRFQELEPNSARSHILLGDIYRQLERKDDAQAEYQKALALAPGDAAALLGLATAYLSNNKLDEAMQAAQAALAQQPDDPELNLVIAEALQGKNEYAQAESYLLKSLSAKPQILSRVHAELGKVYAETGRTQEAIAQLKLGEASDENGSIEFMLSRLYRKVGDNQAAAQALERMKTIREQRRSRGVKLVEDPDLSSGEYSPRAAAAP